MTRSDDAFDGDGAGGDALVEIDRRGRAAASALRTQVEALVAVDDPAPWSGTLGGSTGAAGRPDLTHGLDEVVPGESSDGHDADPATAHVVRLDRDPRRPRGGRGRRRPLALVAAVAAVAAAGAAIAIVDRGDDPDVTSGGPGTVLLPGWLPAGLEPEVAFDPSDAALPGGIGGESAVYGDASAPDPWASTLAVVHLVVPPEAAGDWQFDDGEPVTVAGHEAIVAAIDGTDPGSSGPGWQVRWEVDDGTLAVAGTGLSRDEVLAAAAKATGAPGIGAAGLPDGFAELARGPLDAASPMFFDMATPGAGLVVSYSVPAAGDEDIEGETGLAIVQRPGDAAAVDLLRASYPESEGITVRGRHGAMGRGDHDLVVQWLEPDGQLVSVIGVGFTEQALLQVVDRLRPAGPDEIAALLAEHAAPAAGEFDEVPEGLVEVASGEEPGDGGRWRVVADPATGETLAALTVERVSADSSSSGSSSGMATDGDVPAPPALELTTDSTDGASTLVYGTVVAGATTVTIEAAGGGNTLTLDVQSIDGWGRGVVAGPLTDLDATDAVAVARDANGQELGRQVLYLAPSPLLPEDTGGVTLDPGTCDDLPGDQAGCVRAREQRDVAGGRRLSTAATGTPDPTRSIHRAGARSEVPVRAPRGRRRPAQLTSKATPKSQKSVVEATPCNPTREPRDAPPPSAAPAADVSAVDRGVVRIRTARPASSTHTSTVSWSSSVPDVVR